VEIQISGEEKGGTTLEETVAFAKMCEGTVDILQVRLPMPICPSIGYNSVDHAPMTCRTRQRSSRAARRSWWSPSVASKTRTTWTGTSPPASRPFRHGQGLHLRPALLREDLAGRPDDIVPCIRCNKCHVPSLTGPWSAYARSIPRWAWDPDESDGSAPTRKLKVAVIGGGPAGWSRRCGGGAGS